MPRVTLLVLSLFALVSARAGLARDGSAAEPKAPAAVSDEAVPVTEVEADARPAPDRRPSDDELRGAQAAEVVTEDQE